MWVVKLGGSLAGSEILRLWLSGLAERAGGRVVIVPGGGLFADAVRKAQLQSHFSDWHAHRMALLAMDQYGWMLLGLENKLGPARSLVEIHGALAEGRVPVWLPSNMLAARTDVPATWDITSDSLAAWLAGQLAAEHLVLVKSVAPGVGSIPVEDVVQRGIVDHGFEEFLAECGCIGWWVGDSSHAGFFAMLEEDGKSSGHGEMANILGIGIAKPRRFFVS
jgi:aspartokinase-like uncharacterized kinase